jgi:flagellar biosynthesis/type III secretory pathway protein FliH
MSIRLTDIKPPDKWNEVYKRAFEMSKEIILSKLADMAPEQIVDEIAEIVANAVLDASIEKGKGAEYYACQISTILTAKIEKAKREGYNEGYNAGYMRADIRQLE